MTTKRNLAYHLPSPPSIERAFRSGQQRRDTRERTRGISGCVRNVWAGGQMKILLLLYHFSCTLSREREDNFGRYIKLCSFLIFSFLLVALSLSSFCCFVGWEDLPSSFSDVSLLFCSARWQSIHSFHESRFVFLLFRNHNPHLSLWRGSRM